MLKRRAFLFLRENTNALPVLLAFIKCFKTLISTSAIVGNKKISTFV